MNYKGFLCLLQCWSHVLLQRMENQRYVSLRLVSHEWRRQSKKALLQPSHHINWSTFRLAHRSMIVSITSSVGFYSKFIGGSARSMHSLLWGTSQDLEATDGPPCANSRRAWRLETTTGEAWNGSAKATRDQHASAPGSRQGTEKEEFVEAATPSLTINLLTPAIFTFAQTSHDLVHARLGSKSQHSPSG